MTDFDRLKTALADHYAIERELGSGGMAHVYLARDLKHDRQVAVKVFRPELAASLGSERFLREIQIAAKLSHPHILPLYDSGEADSFLYYVMPLVEGESLGDRLKREQQLPIDEAIQITREVADALNYAHSRGLVHRDIKPDNIMLSGGHAVVMDFGIARAFDAAGGGSLTQTGMAVGTPAYMSPEQAVAAKDLDGRTDIYSLACVLYEMLVGQIPFTGPTPQAVMARHSIDEVPRPQIMRNTIPDGLEDIILTALAKAPADRFKTAGAFSDALAMAGMEASFTSGGQRVTRSMRRSRRKRPQLLTVGLASVGVIGIGLAVYQFGFRSASNRSLGADSGLDASSVAVLYFEDLSPDGQLGDVADGLTEGLIQQLSQVRALDVVSRNGVAPYRDATVSRDSIARALQVGSLIEGSIESVGDRVRVTVRLVDGASAADIQRAGFELPAAALLAVRDSVAQQASRLLREWIGEEVRVREQRAGATNAAAWTLVQRGERLRKDAAELFEHDDVPGGLEAYARADSVLQLAEDADPEWVEPIVLRSRIAYAEARLYDADPHSAEEWIERGQDHAERAVALEPNDGGALEMRGTLRYLQWLLDLTADHDEADALFAAARHDLEAAVEHDPTNAVAHGRLSHLYSQTNDLMSVVIAAQRAYQEDAYLSNVDVIVYRLFSVSYDLEQPSQASQWCSEGTRRFPADYRFARCQLMLMSMPGVEPDVERAWQLAEDMAAFSPERTREYNRHLAQVYVGGAIARASLADSARQVLERARADREVDPRRQLAWTEAYMRLLLGDQDEAIELLTQWVAANPDEIHGADDTEGDYWWWRDLRQDPRFRRVMGGGQ